MTTPPPVTGPGRSSVTRELLDQQLANVAAGLGQYLADVSAAARLAETIVTIPPAVLKAPPPAGFGYSDDDAYSIGLFGNMLTTLLGWWNGQAAAAQTSPTPAQHMVKFVGISGS